MKKIMTRQCKKCGNSIPTYEYLYGRKHTRIFGKRGPKIGINTQKLCKKCKEVRVKKEGENA